VYLPVLLVRPYLVPLCTYTTHGRYHTLTGNIYIPLCCFFLPVCTFLPTGRYSTGTSKIKVRRVQCAEMEKTSHHHKTSLRLPVEPLGSVDHFYTPLFHSTRVQATRKGSKKRELVAHGRTGAITQAKDRFNQGSARAARRDGEDITPPQNLSEATGSLWVQSITCTYPCSIVVGYKPHEKGAKRGS
jgi:hypothetical protein